MTGYSMGHPGVSSSLLPATNSGPHGQTEIHGQAYHCVIPCCCDTTEQRHLPHVSLTTPPNLADAFTSCFAEQPRPRQHKCLTLLTSRISTPCEKLDLVFDGLDRQQADTYCPLAKHNDGPLH